MPKARNKRTTVHALDTLRERLSELERDAALELEKAGHPDKPRARSRSRAGARKVAGGGVAGGILGGIEREIGTRIRGVLERLDLPTRADIEALTKRIVDVEQHLMRQLRARQGRLAGSRNSGRRSNRRRSDA